MEGERDSSESLCIPLEAAPPYCNFLLEPYLEQPETALQQSLVTLLLLTCCRFITVSISLCLFFILPFSLHLPMSVRCHARYTEKDPPTKSSVTQSVSHSVTWPFCNQPNILEYYTLNFLMEVNTNGSLAEHSKTRAEMQTHRKTTEFHLSCSPKLFYRSFQTSY